MRKGVGFEGDSASSAGRIGTQRDVNHAGDDGLTERIADGNHLSPGERREAAVTVPHSAVSRENRAQRHAWLTSHSNLPQRVVGGLRCA